MGKLSRAEAALVTQWPLLARHGCRICLARVAGLIAAAARAFGATAACNQVTDKLQL
jgi:hypothetical protein